MIFTSVSAKNEEEISWMKLQEQSFWPDSFFIHTVSDSTLELEGATSFLIKGKGKSKQIRGAFTVAANGKFLPVHLIYAEKTEHSHPQGIKFPSKFGLTHSESHWSNKTLAHQHLPKVIILYVKQQREELE